MAFSKVLIANRGEIAIRVIRTARRLGFPTVAVYSTADQDAAHVQLADEAVEIGAPPVSESYLVIDKIIAAAKATGADAVHPGYGMLAENADFARACREAQLTFIGPTPESMELMGNKRAAKLAVADADVPCVPGYQGEAQGDDVLVAEAKKIGVPVMVKAAAGGGGRGMRLVEDEAMISEALHAARSEAQSAFGSDELLLEKAVIEPRHVEIQIFADTQGNAVYLGERDCSVQRRHQKVIEESPSPAVDERLRRRMGEAAVRVAKAAKYVGAGTVEFLLDAKGDFYFLEMNTRLQVEHPVTELVTGLDLVEWQLDVAAGHPLPLEQDDIELLGHAIEARVYAEDPSQGFMPQTGPVLAWRLPEAGEARVDHGLGPDQVVSPFYDPLLAKVITHGKDRTEACRKLVAALRDTVLLGVKNNKAFLAAICENPAFVAGEATTAFIGQHLGDHPTLRPLAPDAESFALAALILFAQAREETTTLGWRSGSDVPAKLRIGCGDTQAEVDVRTVGREGGTFSLSVTLGDADPVALTVDLIGLDDQTLCYQSDGVRRRLPYAHRDNEIHMELAAGSARFVDTTNEAAMAADGTGTGVLLAPLDGAVMEILASAGDKVEKGQLLLVLEAMKMQHQIKSDVTGVVAAVHVSPKDQVKTRQALVDVTPAESEV